MCNALDLSPKLVCMDSTSFHLDGKYNSETPPEEDSKTIYITRGYSRDHRPDLCQVVLNLIVENRAGIALNMEAHSGNKVDKVIFKETLDKHISQLQSHYKVAMLLMDSAGYTKATIKEHSDRILWMSWVPENITEARRALASKEAMTPLSEGYSYRMTDSDYGGVKQRWAVIFSEAAYQKEIVTLTKKYNKEV